MLLETFHGTDLRRVFDDARRALGDDVLIVRSAVSRDGGVTRVEVIAARQQDLQSLRARHGSDHPRKGANANSLVTAGEMSCAAYRARQMPMIV